MRKKTAQEAKDGERHFQSLPNVKNNQVIIRISNTDVPEEYTQKVSTALSHNVQPHIFMLK